VSIEGAEDDPGTERIRLWQRRGLLLSDELSLAAMDPSENLFRLCCSRKKDGSLTGDLASREQMRQLKEYVYSVLMKMVDEISSGNVSPNPYTRGTSHNACAYCPYGAVCHKDSVEGRRNYKAMSSQRFWEEIEKEVRKNG
jgi:ATP-dependent helicase/DNAse subunit B